MAIEEEFELLEEYIVALVADAIDTALGRGSIETSIDLMNARNKFKKEVLEINDE